MDPRSSINCKHDKNKENYIYPHHNKLMIIRENKKVLKAARANKTHTIRKTKIRMTAGFKNKTNQKTMK